MLSDLASPMLVVIGLLAGVWFTARLHAVPPARGPRRGSTTVIVPARDEEANLPRLLGSLAPWSAEVEVVVVDDGSTDATAAVVRAHGARLITAPPPPDGWLGKPWACWVGAGAASGERLVFLDADTELGPDGLTALVDAHDRLAADGLLSVQPYHRTEQVYEQASAVANVVSMIGSGCFSPAAPTDRAMAFGPCLVTTASAYRAVGGHRRVATEVIEDIHLARAYREARRPVRALVGGTTVRYRMYPEGIGQLVEGWSKNLSGGFRLAPAGPTVAGALWVTAGLTIALAVIGSLRSWPGATAGAAWPFVAWVAYAAHLHWLLRRIGSFRWWSAWAFPLPLAAFVALFARSAVLRVVRHRVSWRGRTIALHRAGT